MQKNVAVQIGVGVAIILIGFVILIDLFATFIDMKVLLAWWPVVFLLIGFLLISTPASNSVWVGVAMLLAGALAVFDRMDFVDPGLRPIIILVVLVIVGLLIVSPTAVRKNNPS